MARSAECQCESNFTCRHCLQNAKPYLFTPSSNAEIMARSIRVKRYHVQVLVREGSEWAWRRVHPTGGDPYVFTEDEAQQYLESHIATSAAPDRYRLEEL